MYLNFKEIEYEIHGYGWVNSGCSLIGNSRSVRMVRIANAAYKGIDTVTCQKDR